MRAGPDIPDVTISWLTTHDRVQEIIDLFVSATGPEYPSHSDLMEGRAINPGEWSPDLTASLANEFMALELSDSPFTHPGTRIAVIRENSKLLGFAVVSHILMTGGRPNPVRFGRLDDIVVDPDARGSGVGSALLSWIEKALKESGIERVFLESGIQNTKAHQFFARHGFDKISVNMLKDL